MSLSIGKRRGLSECATSGGVFAILALDQRESMRKALQPEDPKSVSYKNLAALKHSIVSILSDEASAVLLDPEFSVAENLMSDAVPGNVGFITALEETGFSGEKNARISKLLPGWSVAKAKRVGASGVKLLVYYHPGSDFAKQQRDLILEVAEECDSHDIAFFLEPLTYSIDPELPTLTQGERRKIIVQTASDLSQAGADVLKLEFPVDVHDEPDESIWLSACEELNDACAIPWVLLSAGVNFDLFLKQVVVACSSGASGIMVGRAVWKEAMVLDENGREKFLSNTAKERLIKLRSVVEGLAKPWKSYYPPTEISKNWYQDYS